MDFTHSRSRLGGGGSGGPHMVKTYGRFRQRVVNRSAAVQEFARVTSARPIIADLLESSSDSDFADPAPSKKAPANGKPRMASDSGTKHVAAKENSEPAAQDATLVCEPSAAGPSRRGPQKGRQKNGKTKLAGSTKAGPSGKNSTENKAPVARSNPAKATRQRSGTKSRSASPVAPPASLDVADTEHGVATQPTPREPPKRRSRARTEADTTANPRPVRSQPIKKPTTTEVPGVIDAGVNDSPSPIPDPAPEYAREGCKAEPVAAEPYMSRSDEQLATTQSPLSSGNVAMRRTGRTRRLPPVERPQDIPSEIQPAPAAEECGSPVSNERCSVEDSHAPVEPATLKHERDLSRRLSQFSIGGPELTTDSVREPTPEPESSVGSVSEQQGERILGTSDSNNAMAALDTHGDAKEHGVPPAVTEPEQPVPAPPAIDAAAPSLPKETQISASRDRSRPSMGGDAGDDGDDDEHNAARQHLAARAMRFKAPRNARVQTFELDDHDEYSHSERPEDSVDAAIGYDAPATPPRRISRDSDRRSTAVVHTQQETQEYLSSQSHYDEGSLQGQEQTEENEPVAASPSHLPSTPVKSKRGAIDTLADVPHSPSRMATPHRVVYSPTRPMTQLKTRMDPAALKRSTLSTVVPSLPLASPIPAAKASEKSRPSLPAKLRRSLSKGGELAGRTSTAEGADEPEIEETKVPFLPARRYVQKTHILAACGQTAPIDWVNGGLQACGVLLPTADPAEHSAAQMNEIETEAGLCKIGEATYSEVFSAQWRYVPKTRYDKFNSKKGAVKGERLMQVALKVIPFGNASVKSGTGEPQTTLRDLYQEIGATLALSRLSERERAKLQEARLQVKMPLKPKERELGANFVKAFRVCICQGPLPVPLLRAWDRWQEEYPDLCENVRPDYYPSNQLFAVFVLEMGGETLENAAVSTWKEARSIIRQLALSMALAERNNRFEHRDLHWGNIMVTRYQSNLTFLYQLPPTGSRLRSTLISIPSYKVRCTIIDYTLSRLHIDNDAKDGVAASKPASYDPANNVFYVALKDEALFQGEGDIQFEVYRQMRGCAQNNWEGFHPHTNVLWLAYVLQKILTTKAAAIKDELMAFAEGKLGQAFDGASVELKRAAAQELLRRWMREFEQCDSSSQVLKCALLDLYKS